MLSFLKPTFRDIIDILIVAIFIFYFLKLLKGARALRMLYALLFIFIGAFVATWLDLKALSLIFNSLKTVWIVIFVILFQPEIRNALARFGRIRAFRFLLQPGLEEEDIDEIIKTCEQLKENRFGGLIVIERQIGLRDIIETGVRIDANITSALLTSIFMPDSPLHDGACIISGNQIAAAACTLPLAEVPDVKVHLGMRHRAGIGVTNISDAVSIIVSEETGRISFAEKGNILLGLTIGELKYNLLRTIFKKPLKY
ncbi:MAG: diadenylate cyclase CdaA [candidate division WOR-3 bacterium]|nr:diadenylate cyclase CdaA [candidate division WOR-3 bacterium]